MLNNKYRALPILMLIGCNAPHSGTSDATQQQDATTQQDGPGVVTDAGAGDASGADIVPGAPIQAPDGVWTEVDFPDGYCRDGEKAHLMVHLNSASKKAAIFLQGGGACFNDLSCTLLTNDLPTYLDGGGIFNFTRADNPIGDWNIFYVPYCSGDVHAGANPMGYPGPITGTQNYTGYSNLKLYISRVLGTVPDATDMLLVGVSAGGVGAGLTADLFGRNAPASVQRLTLLDDSGPPMSSQYIATCMQDEWRQVWGFDDSFLKDCGSACPKHDDYVMDWIQFLMSKYGQGTSDRFRAGLLSHANDAVISLFYGFGANNCANVIPTSLTGAQFEAGLIDFRASVSAYSDKFGMYIDAGTTHTFLASDVDLYNTTVNGVKLTDWISALLDRTSVSNVGP